MKYFIAFAFLCLFAVVTFGHHNSGHGEKRFFINAPRNVIRNPNLPSCKNNEKCPTGTFCDTQTGQCRKLLDGKQ
uniref:Uncharacterized protein n=1 Tax=Panagrolaimus sp. PS1159 TaxID=55785 RepID=A0AC35FEV5_9BILA